MAPGAVGRKFSWTCARNVVCVSDMPHSVRDRVTIDLRGAGSRVRERAAAWGLPLAAFVRRAALASIENSEPSGNVPLNGAATAGQQVKVTLRLPAAHAVLLATRARKADVSQGAYVAGLLDDMPPPPATSDRAEALRALLRSTDQLAAISADFNDFLRLLRRGSSAGLEAYRVGVMSLSEDVRRHLEVASRCLADVRGADSCPCTPEEAVMSAGPAIDGVLVQWGERLFYPGNRIVRNPGTPRLDTLIRRKAAVIRGRIVATVRRRAPQVMVKVTGGGRGMAAIAAHFRYISKSGRLDIEDDRGEVRQGRAALRDLADQWRLAGAMLPNEGHRREAFNIMLSMPKGTDPLIVQRAAREFAAVELTNHRYVMVLHEHQANPHVHLSVRATGRDGSRLNPRKADLHRWRETFAEKVRGWGIEAEATRQATRGEIHRSDALWRLKAGAQGRLQSARATIKSGNGHRTTRLASLTAWAHIAQALQGSDRAEDQALAREIMHFANDSPFVRAERQQQRAVQADVIRPGTRARLVEPAMPVPRDIGQTPDPIRDR